jgi:hypothetical protein
MVGSGQVKESQRLACMHGEKGRGEKMEKRRTTIPRSM